MSNARDKANIPALNFSSTGIDDNANATAITISASNNVGIGNAGNALRRLDITQTSGLQAGVRVVTDGSGAYYQMFGGVAQTKIGSSHNSEDIEFHNGSGEKVRITSDGKVGIGTSSPSPDYGSDNILEIAGSSNPGLVINDTGQASKYSIHAVSADFVMNYGTTAFLRYKPGDSQLTSHDNVRIITGTSSGVTPNTIADKLFIDGIGNQGLTIGSGNTSVGSVVFADNGDNDIGKLQYNHNDNSMSFTVNASERIRIDSSGNVGIGTSSPASNLDIFTDASGEGILVKSTGNTYNDIIGDANRSGAGNNLVRFRGNWNGNSVAMIAISAGDDTTNKDDGRLEFFTSASGSSQNKRMVIEPNGNVGIGTSSPSEKLDVSGSINLTDSLLIDGAIKFEAVKSSSTGQDSIYKTATNTLAFNTGGTERMRINSSGYVGIGTSSPSTPLQVNGTARASNFNTLSTQLVMNNSSQDWDISGVIGTIANVEGSISFELTMKERNASSVQLFRVYYIRVGTGTTFDISSAVWSVGSTAATTTISYPSAGTIRFTNSSFSVLDVQIRRISA